MQILNSVDERRQKKERMKKEHEKRLTLRWILLNFCWLKLFDTLGRLWLIQISYLTKNNNKSLLTGPKLPYVTNIKFQKDLSILTHFKFINGFGFLFVCVATMLSHGVDRFVFFFRFRTIDVFFSLKSDMSYSVVYVVRDLILNLFIFSFFAHSSDIFIASIHLLYVDVNV